ncbi:O-Antigen ligase [Chitinophaga sp. CF118]|uniref:O-antigen ligase family protein n=1 Tax=Chitinophaga sp. CF118 TaxID=1884367 RepID=UPI0008ED02B9|nr:O-antigen ligase family protein [Chitinophaga sp. CF118]SFE92836.1 O-Antigen ligase [Chitinophaga sp. CF118]
MSIASIQKTRWFKGAKLFDSPWAYTIMLLIAVSISCIIGYGDYRIGFLIIAGLIAGMVALICMFNTRLGFIITTILAFFMFYPKHFIADNLPTGIVIDILIALTFIGAYYKKSIHKQRLWEYMSSPVTVVYIIYMGFLLIELFNPSMDSVSGWIFTVRKFLNFMMIYFIGLHIFNSLNDIKDYLKLWLYLAILAGAYGCFQQWFGLPSFEERWVMDDPIRYKLYFQGGEIRKFSFLSDPTAFGILMGISIVYAIAAAMNEERKKQRWLLIIGILLMVLGMSYSGTRTAYFIIPAGLCVYVLMTINNRKTLLFMVGFLLFFMVLIFGPFYSNSTVNRIRTSFKLSDDESMNVRDKNREMIRPYMLSHPMGGGVATTGVLGQEYNPGHPLAGFPPDSGYLRTALETGWIGLGYTLIMFFITLLVAVKNYYRSRSKEVRTIYVAIVASLYAFIIAQYAQVAIGQMPGSFFFYSAMAIIVKLKNFDTPHNQHPINIKKITT